MSEYTVYKCPACSETYPSAKLHECPQSTTHAAGLRKLIDMQIESWWKRTADPDFHVAPNVPELTDRVRDIVLDCMHWSKVRDEVAAMVRDEIRAASGVQMVEDVMAAAIKIRARDEAFEEAARTFKLAVLGGGDAEYCVQRIRALKSQPAAAQPSGHHVADASKMHHQTCALPMQQPEQPSASCAYGMEKPAHQVIDELRKERDELRAGRSRADSEYRALWEKHEARLLEIAERKKEMEALRSRIGAAAADYNKQADCLASTMEERDSLLLKLQAEKDAHAKDNDRWKLLHRTALEEMQRLSERPMNSSLQALADKDKRLTMIEERLGNVLDGLVREIKKRQGLQAELEEFKERTRSIRDALNDIGQLCITDGLWFVSIKKVKRILERVGIWS